MKKQNIEENYFSVHNLDKLAEIDEHMSFIEELVEKYNCIPQDTGQTEADGGEWDLIQEQLRLIRKKMNEKKLNISIIGEFSTGKSTFINALLRKELLASSALQGTTVASTILDYDSQYRIHLEYLDGRQEQNLAYPAFADLKNDLDRYTTEPEVAKLLKTVRVYLPSETLKNNFRIIDTPGTNVTEAWHEDVTVRTLENDSDLSIILISAEKPAPETMLEFVEKNLTSILPQCVFVVTKLDLIRKRERMQQLSYVKMRLEEELGLKDAVVLPYISPLVLDSQATDSERYVKPGIDSEQGTREAIPVDEELLKLSLETEHELFLHTARQRTVVQTKKLLQLMQITYNTLKEQLERLTQRYEGRLAYLERTKQTDLGSFISSQCLERGQDFDDKILADKDKLEQELAVQVWNAKKRIIGKLDSLDSVDKMKNYLTGSELKNACNEEVQKLTNRTAAISTPAENLFQSEMQLFMLQFKKLYQRLKILEVDVKLEQYQPNCRISNVAVDFSSTTAYINDAVSKENWSFFGGAAAGAAIGTAIAPGIGTVIGGFVGMIMGTSSDEKINQVRKNCKEKLEPILSNYFNRVESQVVLSIENYLNEMKKGLEKQFQRYLETYFAEVNRQISIEEKERAGVKAKIHALKQEIVQLENREKRLESFYEQLNKLGRTQCSPSFTAL